tara:strand:- start:35721 stop:38591 length:2871 start_codon:yes stop_codon:yes gene_type:complete
VAQNSTASMSNYFSNIEVWDSNSAMAIGGNTLLNTQDQGASWSFTPVDNFNYIWALWDAAIVNETVGVVVGDKGLVLRTENKGISWERIPLFNGDERIMDLHFVDNIGYMVGRYDDENDIVRRFLYTSTDLGQTWQIVPSNISGLGGFNPQFNVYFTTPTKGFLRVNSDIYTTLDGGITWTEFLEAPAGLNVSTMRFLSPTLGFAKGPTGGPVYKTIDGGATWEPLNFTESATLFEVTDEKIYYVVYSDEIRVANHDGSNETSTVFPQVGYATEIEFLDNNVGYYSVRKSQALSSGGRFVYKTTDGGISWEIIDHLGTNESISNSYNFLKKTQSDTYVLSLLNSYPGDSQTYVTHSYDDGASWQVTKTYDTAGFILYANDDFISHIRYADPNNSGGGAIVSRSFDNGQTWQDDPIISGAESSYIDYWHQMTENEVWFNIGNDIKFSSDSGQTWSVITPPAGIVSFRSQFVTTEIAYLYGRNPSDVPVVFKTDDRGVTWTELFTLTNDTFTYGYDSFDFSDPERIIVHPYYPGDNIYLYNNTTDILTAVPTTDYINKIYSTDANSFIVYTNNDGLRYTNNNGADFMQLKLSGGGTGNPPIYVEDSETFILFSYEYMERLNLGAPEAPDYLNGPVNTNLATTSHYIVPASINGDTEWELVSGGNLVLNPDQERFRASVQWTSPGVHTLRARYTTELGNSMYSDIQVTVNNVVDNEPPNVIVNNFTVALNEDGVAIISTDDIDNGTTDNITPVELLIFELDTYSFNCNTIGENIVQFTATDLSGNSATAEAIVTVVDNLPPNVLTENITVDLEGNASVSINPEDVDNGSTDNCESISLTLDIDTFTEVGTYTVLLSATDGNDNTANETAVVEVIDSVLGVTDFNQQDVVLFPNPTTGALTIETNLHFTEILLYDVSGRLVKSMMFHNQLEFSTLSPGIYFLELKADTDATSRTFKFVKI